MLFGMYGCNGPSLGPSHTLSLSSHTSPHRYDDSESQEGRLEQRTDGMYVRYLPAPLLREVNIVDTPGTNVILDRQQRLTEEYVPRADLVLFVMSADRPFSESEVKFLEYIRQWKKKVWGVCGERELCVGGGELVFTFSCRVWEDGGGLGQRTWGAGGEGKGIGQGGSEGGRGEGARKGGAVHREGGKGELLAGKW